MQRAWLLSEKASCKMNATLTEPNTIRAVLLVAALALCGCASISEHTYAYLGSPQLSATNPERVRIFAAEPKQPKERLGEISLAIEGNPSREKIEHRLQVAAARLGADGVFIAVSYTHLTLPTILRV